VIVYGNPNTAGLNLRILGSATVNADRVSANTGNAIQINTLSIANSTLTVSGGNNYRLLVAGTTSIQGNAAIFSASSNAPQVLELAGPITDGGKGFAFTRGGSGTGVVVVSGTSNSYTGGTNVTAGVLQVTGTSGTPLGTGPVTVYRANILRIAANASLHCLGVEPGVHKRGSRHPDAGRQFHPERDHQERLQLDLWRGSRNRDGLLQRGHRSVGHADVPRQLRDIGHA
jgi:autotransporter-associated beta strand protein